MTVTLLSRQEAAKQLRVSTRTVINYVAAKKLRETRIASARGNRSIPRYKQSDVDAFIASAYTR